jgi:hypothetical protein
MRSIRQFLLFALGGGCLVAALFFFSMTPPGTRTPGQARGDTSPPPEQVSSLKTVTGANTSDPASDTNTTNTTNTTDASILATATKAASTPLDDLHARVEALAKSARTLRQRYKITDPDPENAEAKVTIDATAGVMAKLNYELTQTAQAHGAGFVLSSSATTGSTGKTLTLLSDAASDPNTATLTYSKVSDGAVVLDAMPNVTFTVSSSKADTTGLLMTGSGTLNLQPSQRALDEMRATVEALRHPDEAKAEYQRAKAEYLAAKQQYQAANLAPLPPERIKNWRLPPAAGAPPQHQ